MSVSFQTSSAVRARSHATAKQGSPEQAVPGNSSANTTVKQYPRLVTQSSLQVKLNDFYLRNSVTPFVEHSSSATLCHLVHQSTSSDKQVRHQSRLCTTNSLLRLRCILTLGFDGHCCGSFLAASCETVLRDPDVVAELGCSGFHES